MSEVAFHFNVPDVPAYACRLLRKAVASEARVLVYAEPDSVRLLDRLLWTFSAHDFVAHCDDAAPSAMQSASPVLLTSSGETLEKASDRGVLLNLGGEVPQGYERFNRVVEFVGMEDVARSAARLRWRRYQTDGCTLVRHDVSQLIYHG